MSMGMLIFSGVETRVRGWDSRSGGERLGVLGGVEGGGLGTSYIVWEKNK